MTSSTPQQNVYLAEPMNWRKVTDLHREMGARAINNVNALNMAANAQITLFNDVFGPQTIDRIIGVNLRLGAVNGPGTITLADLNGGNVYPIMATNHFGNYWFNIDTALEAPNLVLVSSVIITPAMQAGWAFFNFEVPPASIGHSG